MYQVINEMKIRRLADGAEIPVSVDNMEYQEYLVWLHEGGIPLPSEGEPQYVPQTVSRYQARAALLEAGLLEAVETHFSALPDSSLDKLAWKEAPTVNRGSEALEAAASALGLSPEQVDGLFLRATQFL